MASKRQRDEGKVGRDARAKAPRRDGKPSRDGGHHASGKPRPGAKGEAPKPQRFRRDIAMESSGIAPLLTRAKRIWNILREKATPGAKRRELVEQLMGLIKGHVRDLVMKHDASRVVQSAIRHGAAEAQISLAAEMSREGMILELAKAKYGHQLVCKLLRWGAGPARRTVFTELKGQFPRLVTHAQGAVVVEMGWTRGFTGAQRWQVEQELFGQAFRHIREAVPEVAAERTLEGVLAKEEEMSPASAARSRALVVAALAELLQRAADKALLGITVLHRAAADLFAVTRGRLPKQAQAAVQPLRDAVVALAASRDGGRAACAALGYGSAKDRKVACRRIGEHALEMATHDVGALIIARALAVTDDTKMLASTVLKPLGMADPVDAHAVARLARDRAGRKVLLQLLAPLGPWLAPDERPLFEEYRVPAKRAKADAASDAAPAAGAADAAAAFDKAVAGGDAASAAAAPKQEGELVPTSKKEPARRAAELLRSAGPAIADAVCVAAPRMLVSGPGMEVLLEAAWVLGVEGGDDRVLAAAAEACLAEGGEDEPEPAAAAAAASSSSSSGSDGEEDTEAADEGKEDDEGKEEEEEDDDDDDDDAEAAAAAEDEEEEEEEPVPGSAREMLELPQTALFVKKLLLRERKHAETGGAAKASFAGALLAAFRERGDEALAAAMASNRGAFTVVTMCESPVAGEAAREWVSSRSAVLDSAPKCKGKAILTKVLRK